MSESVKSGDMIGRARRLAMHYLDKYRILNFMVVGGIGFVVNMATYWPLTLVFKTQQTVIFGQQYYLPPFVISSLVAIVCNYTLNKVWTFRDQKARQLSFLRYLSMASVTLVFDMALLWAFVTFGKVPPVVGAALAIMVVFVVRYAIARKWIWHDRRPGATKTP